MPMKCPKCDADLKGSGSRYTCPECRVDYVVRFTCRKCGSEPEELAACGSVGFFCPTCKELRSRTAMDKEFTVL